MSNSNPGFCLHGPRNQGRIESVVAIDLFHDLNIALSVFKIVLHASFWITYSLDFNACERGLMGKLEWRQKNIETVKMSINILNVN